MRKLGLLLTLVTVLILAMASPAVAAPGGRAADAPGADHRPTDGTTPGPQQDDSTRGALHDDTTTGPQLDGNAQQQSGSGMNREAGPGTHPGNGWKDPGQDQGSPADTADPDCTGNRSSGPQATNIGACDVPTGAADKPGGTGGFDADKDWNNGCGNDTDFEDDNNGRCQGPAGPGAQQPSATPPPTVPCTPEEQPASHPPTNPPSNPPSQPPSNPPSNPPSQPPTNPPTNLPGGSNPSESPPVTITPPTPPPVVTVGGPVSTPPRTPPGVPTVVTVGGPVTSPPTTERVNGSLPFTGPSHTVDLTALGLALIAVGTRMVSYERRRG